jgi:hypothetical protein
VQIDEFWAGFSGVCITWLAMLLSQFNSVIKELIELYASVYLQNGRLYTMPTNTVLTAGYKSSTQVLLS